MQNKGFKYPDNAAYNYVINYLTEKGVTIGDIADIAYSYEKDYVDGLTRGKAVSAVMSVLHKRDVANAAMVGFNLDKLATAGKLDQPLQDIVENDAGVFGIDELLATGIATLYGNIGSTNFGYADKDKTGIIKELDTEKGRVNTFVDDIVGAIAAAAAAKITHDNA